MPWTLGQMKAQGKALWSSCPKRTAMLVLDLEALIGELGDEFDVTAGDFARRVGCPCGSAEHEPFIGIEDGERFRRGSPGGAHRHGPPVSIEEATRRALELSREARETNPLERARHEKLQADLAKIRERRRRRRARNPYDFS